MDKVSDYVYSLLEAICFQSVFLLGKIFVSISY